MFTRFIHLSRYKLALFRMVYPTVEEMGPDCISHGE